MSIPQLLVLPISFFPEDEGATKARCEYHSLRAKFIQEHAQSHRGLALVRCKGHGLAAHEACSFARPLILPCKADLLVKPALCAAAGSHTVRRQQGSASDTPKLVFIEVTSKQPEEEEWDADELAEVTTMSKRGSADSIPPPHARLSDIIKYNKGIMDGFMRHERCKAEQPHKYDAQAMHTTTHHQVRGGAPVMETHHVMSKSSLTSTAALATGMHRSSTQSQAVELILSRITQLQQTIEKLKRDVLLLVGSPPTADSSLCKQHPKRSRPVSSPSDPDSLEDGESLQPQHKRQCMQPEPRNQSHIVSAVANSEDDDSDECDEEHRADNSDGDDQHESDNCSQTSDQSDYSQRYIGDPFRQEEEEEEEEKRNKAKRLRRSQFEDRWRQPLTIAGKTAQHQLAQRFLGCPKYEKKAGAKNTISSCLE